MAADRPIFFKALLKCLEALVGAEEGEGQAVVKLMCVERLVQQVALVRKAVLVASVFVKARMQTVCPQPQEAVVFPLREHTLRRVCLEMAAMVLDYLLPR